MGIPILDLGGKDGAQHGVIARGRIKGVDEMLDVVFAADFLAVGSETCVGEGGGIIHGLP